MCEQQRHKWADVIHAYAEGKPIQWRRGWGQYPTDWADYNEKTSPGFSSEVEWRIKPEKKTYWVNIYKSNPFPLLSVSYLSKEDAEKRIIRLNNYIKTISYEVEE